MEVQDNEAVFKTESALPKRNKNLDGGYAWTVLFAAFMVYMILDGVVFTFGIFYIQFLDHYQASRSTTSWISSIFNGLSLLLGPITGSLINRFGCRIVTMFGALFSAIVLAVSTCSPNVDVLILLYGVLGGSGFGFLFLPPVVMVGYYFERRRALATGITVCGSGVGAFLFAPLSEWLIAAFGWKGALLILSGIVLNIAVMGALFRDFREEEQSSVNGEELSYSVDGVPPPPTTTGGLTIETNLDSGFSERLIAASPKEDLLLEEDVEDFESIDEDEALAKIDLTRRASKSVGHLPLYFDQSECSLDILHSSLDVRVQRTPNLIGQGLMLRKFLRSKYHHQQVYGTNQYFGKPMYRKDIFFSGNINNIDEYRSRSNTGAKVVENVVYDHTTTTDMNRNEARQRFEWLITFWEMTNLSLLKEKIFLLYCCSCFLFMIGFFIPVVYLPDLVKAYGYTSEQAAMSMSIFGITNIIGRVAIGRLADLKLVSPMVINGTVLVTGGIFTIMLPFWKPYAWLITATVLYGCAISTFVSLRSIIAVELLGLENLTNAFGLITMCQGMSTLIGPPLAGILRESTGGYEMPFGLAGICILLSGLFSLLLTFRQR